MLKIEEVSFMKKWRTPAIIIGFLCLVIAAWYIMGTMTGPSYLRVITENWNISLPSNCKELYRTDSGESFHGDGERYHVFQYDSDAAPSLPISKQEVPDKDRKCIAEILSFLKIEKGYEPDFNSVTYEGSWDRYNGSNLLYLCYSARNRTLYVIEKFL
jgi:hypothetical protein